MKLKVNDICFVLNSGKIYGGNTEFAAKSGHPDAILNLQLERNTNHSFLNKQSVKILYLAKHPNFEWEALAVVETINEG